MPGPPRWRTPVLIHHSLTAQKLLLPTINERVTNLLTFIQQQAKRNPDIVYGDGVERSRDSPEARQFCRRLAAEGMVLLRNQSDTLPISQVKQIAVIGPHVQERIISGGGSAALKPTYVTTPWQGIQNAVPKGVTTVYTVGCYGTLACERYLCSQLNDYHPLAHKYLPTLENNLTAPDGKSGWLCTFYNQDANGKPTKAVADFILNDTRVKLNDFLPSGLADEWTIKLSGKLTVETSGLYELGLTVAGESYCLVRPLLFSR